MNLDDHIAAAMALAAIRSEEERLDVRGDRNAPDDSLLAFDPDALAARIRKGF